MEGSLTAVAIILLVLAAAAVSRRIQNTIITLPILYTFFGLLLSEKGFGLVTLGLNNELVEIIAELTLIIVLATDASRISFHRLQKDHNLPIRLLVFGLPLTIILGTVVALGLFTGIPFWEAAIIGIILAPTDASLGMAVVTNPKVPVRIRQTLNVESGLNDGLGMPFLLMATSFAAAEATNDFGYWLLFAGRQIVIGALGGLLIGYFGARFIQWGRNSGWMSIEFQKIGALAIGVLAYGVAELLGGNGFIAAFVAGATAGNLYKGKPSKELHDYAEVEVQFMMMLTFMIVFGAVMLPAALDNLSIHIILYALLSLSVIRMLPVGISLLGSKINPLSITFLGWFGPRGTASILYLFIVLEEESLSNLELISTAVLATVLFSIVLHGMTAVPGTDAYCKHLPKRIDPQGTEMTDVPEMPIRPTNLTH